MSDSNRSQGIPDTVDPLAQADPDFVTPFDDLYTKAWSPGAIPAKYKELCGVALSVAVRCEPCVAYHIRMCLGEHATRAELTEAIRIGIICGGSITIPTARFAYKVILEAL
jgi:AhpD family alkylhydroperoxidase